MTQVGKSEEQCSQDWDPQVVTKSRKMITIAEVFPKKKGSKFHIVLPRLGVLHQEDETRNQLQGGKKKQQPTKHQTHGIQNMLLKNQRVTHLSSQMGS